MPYAYVAYSADKKIVKGTLNAIGENSAAEALERAGYRVLSLKQVRPSPSLEQLLPTLFGIKSRDMIAMSRQLATLIGSGIPLTTALQLLQEQVTSGPLRRVIAELLQDLQGGSSFSAALAKHPQVFPDIYRHIVGWGQEAGNLDVALRQAVNYMARGTAAMQKVQRAMVYPAMVLLLSVGVVSLLMIVALPPLVGMFTGLGVELPWTTRLLIASTHFTGRYKFYLLGTGLALAILIPLYLWRPAGRLMLDKLRLKAPVIRAIVIQSNMSLISRTMSVLLKSGLPLTGIMDILCQTTGNRVIRQALVEVREGLPQGRGLAHCMAAHPVFPRLMVQTVMVGEQTDSLDSSLTTLADFYEDELEQKLNGLVSLIEPAMTLFIGLVVAFIALSLVMPMYSILGAVK